MFYLQKRDPSGGLPTAQRRQITATWGRTDKTAVYLLVGALVLGPWIGGGSAFAAPPSGRPTTQRGSKPEVGMTMTFDHGRGRVQFRTTRAPVVTIAIHRSDEPRAIVPSPRKRTSERLVAFYGGTRRQQPTGQSSLGPLGSESGTMTVTRWPSSRLALALWLARRDLQPSSQAPAAGPALKPLSSDFATPAQTYAIHAWQSWQRLADHRLTLPSAPSPKPHAPFTVALLVEGPFSVARLRETFEEQVGKLAADAVLQTQPASPAAGSAPTKTSRFPRYPSRRMSSVRFLGPKANGVVVGVRIVGPTAAERTLVQRLASELQRLANKGGAKSGGPTALSQRQLQTHGVASFKADTRHGETWCDLALITRLDKHQDPADVARWLESILQHARPSATEHGPSLRERLLELAHPNWFDRDPRPTDRKGLMTKFARFRSVTLELYGISGRPKPHYDEAEVKDLVVESPEETTAP